MPSAGDIVPNVLLRCPRVTSRDVYRGPYRHLRTSLRLQHRAYTPQITAGYSGSSSLHAADAGSWPLQQGSDFLTCRTTASPAAYASHFSPTPTEVHHVIARAAQGGQWSRAVRLLLGALQSRCVPLAETYRLVLLATLRGGGWRAIVQLTQQVATSSLSSIALYHAAADLLAEAHHESLSSSDGLQRAVQEELAPLMLDDATRHVPWLPRHRKVVLQSLYEAGQMQEISALFRCWTSAADSAVHPRYSAEEVDVLMAAFGSTGDWRSAELLRWSTDGVRVTSLALVNYVRAYTTAVQCADSPASKDSQALIPWELAINGTASAATRGGTSSGPLASAVEELRLAGQQTASYANLMQWWSTKASTHAKLTELRRRTSTSMKEGAQLLADCHVTTAEVKTLLEAVRTSGVLQGETAAATTSYYMEWVNVVLVLCCCSPHALISSQGYADGLPRLLPQPLLKVYLQNPVTVLQYVSKTLNKSFSLGSSSSVAGYVVQIAAMVWYIRSAKPDAALKTESEKSLTTSFKEELQRTRAKRRQQGLPYDLRSSFGDVAVLVTTLSAFVTVPSTENIFALLLSSTADAIPWVDLPLLKILETLQTLGTVEEVCEVVCRAGEGASLSSAPLAQLLVLVVIFVCHELRCGTSLVHLRPVLRRTEKLFQRVPDAADALILLNAHLQLCWGSSDEALRSQAVPVLVRHERWSILSQLLQRFSLPLSASEQLLLARCGDGIRKEKLQNLVKAADAKAAWRYWQQELCSDGNLFQSASPLRSALVSLLLSEDMVAEAQLVLAASPSMDVPELSRSQWLAAALRVFDGASRWPREGQKVELIDLWGMAMPAGECGRTWDVQRREVTVALSLYAGLALSHAGDERHAFEVVSKAVDYVLQHDAACHLAPLFSRTSGPETPDSLGEPAQTSALRKTDMQLVALLPFYVQRVVPRIICGFLSLLEILDRPAAPYTVSPKSLKEVEMVLRVTQYLLPLTSSHPSSTMEWSAVFPRIYSAATATGRTKADVEAMCRQLLHRAAHEGFAVSLPFLQHVVATLPCSTEVNQAVQRSLLILLQSSPTSSTRGEIKALAAQVAHSLARLGECERALLWVEVFTPCQAHSSSLDSVVNLDTQLSWLQAANGAVQHRAEVRSSLLQKRRMSQTVDGGTAAWAKRFSLEALDALLSCDAWEEAMDCVLYVMGEPQARRSSSEGVVADTSTTDYTSDAPLVLLELREAYLSASVLKRVMHCVARCAPWRTAVQAWLLLTRNAPLIPWKTFAEELESSLIELLMTMRRQKAAPYEVGTVVIWMIIQLELPQSVTSALISLFAESITAVTERDPPARWTEAEAKLCAATVKDLRRVTGERRVGEAERAIIAAQAALSLSCSPGPMADSIDNEAHMIISADSWVPPGRPLLSSEELDTLAVLAPLLLLSTTPQLESLARQHLQGRFAAHELKALLYFYKEELQSRIDATREADVSLAQYLSQNTTLHVLLSEFDAVGAPRSNRCDADAASFAVRRMVHDIFDGLLSFSTATVLWEQCKAPAALLAACRWPSITEVELCETLMHQYGKPPPQLCTAPHLTRRSIAHYWSCYHRVLIPELHFGPLELCCLSSYAPALTDLRIRNPDPTQPGYARDIAELAGQAHRAHFCSNRVPSEDTLAYVRRPHSPAAIAAVFTCAHKKLKLLHAQLTDCDATMRRSLVPALELLFRQQKTADGAVCDEGASSADWHPQRLASIARGLILNSGPASFQPRGRMEQEDFEAPLVRWWAQWVIRYTSLHPQQPIPPTASLLLMEWAKQALKSNLGTFSPSPTPPFSSAAMEKGVVDVRQLWRTTARAGRQDLQLSRCRDMTAAWQLLTRLKLWGLLNSGHATALRNLVRPHNIHIESLPVKRRPSSRHTGQEV